MDEAECLEDVYDFVHSLQDLDEELEGPNLHDERYLEVYDELINEATNLSNEGVDIDVALLERSVLRCDFDRAVDILDDANPRYRTEVYDDPFSPSGL